jgi:hypothetical protein
MMMSRSEPGQGEGRRPMWTACSLSPPVSYPTCTYVSFCLHLSPILSEASLGWRESGRRSLARTCSSPPSSLATPPNAHDRPISHQSRDLDKVSQRSPCQDRSSTRTSSAHKPSQVLSGPRSLLSCRTSPKRAQPKMAFDLTARPTSSRSSSS